MNDHDTLRHGEEDATARLLRLAGPRSPVPAFRAARVRTAVNAHWQAARRRRAGRRQLIYGSASLAAAVVVVLTLGRVMLVDRGETSLGDPVAVVERVDGGLPRRVLDGPDASAAAALSANDTIRAREWIETDARTRLALRFSDGTSVRLDRDSRARPLSSSVIELSTGAVYVDTGRESGHFEVRTAFATAHDVGTQFEVRLLDRTLRLRVRTGVVELKDGARSVAGRGGTEITLSPTGAVSRPITAYGSEWGWMERVSPALDIEGLALSDFLERIAREHGWMLRYADPALGREALDILLHGSVRGLPPREAVDVAITTSGLRHRLENGELLVLRERNVR